LGRLEIAAILAAGLIIPTTGLTLGSEGPPSAENPGDASAWADAVTRVTTGGKPGPVQVVNLGDLPRAEVVAGSVSEEEREVVPNIFPDSQEIPGGADPLSGSTELSGPLPTPVGTGGEDGSSGAGGSTDASFPTIDVRFDGPYDAFVAPPDPVIAVGDSHVVSLINRLISVYDKSGSLLQGPTSLRDFFGIPSSFSSFDPLAVYDPFSDRYIVVCTSKNDSQQDSRLYVAFSQSADATAGWNTYFIDADRDQAGNWADYPSIGIDRNAVYLTANMFSFVGFFQNVTLFVYDKEDGYAGRDLDNTHLIDVRSASSGSPFRLRPATIEQTVPGDVFYLAQSSNSFGSVINLFRLTGDRFEAPSLEASTVGLPGTYSGPGGARQPGTDSPGVDTLGGSVWNVIYRDGDLWTAHAIESSPSIGAWVHRIAVDSSSATREQTYEVSDAENDAYFPYVLPDAEDDDFALLTAYSGPDRHVTGRYWNVGADGTVRQTELLEDSGRLNTSDRHGDYFAVGYDPTDRNRLWMIAQFMRDSSFAGNQKIASVRFENEDGGSASPPPLPDGNAVPGEQVQLSKATGDEVTVTWDATTCPAKDNHLIWYDLETMASYTVTDERCDVGTAGTWTGLPPTGNVAVIVAGDDDADTEGSHGLDSRGSERPSSSALCTSVKVTDGTCTP
jgi:hypothetical protein